MVPVHFSDYLTKGIKNIFITSVKITMWGLKWERFWRGLQCDIKNGH
ncbi:hypothetical protein B4102_2402 [Heyndrickxia sporothermodurans]|uniref:Uncharacterized protein n=1 Tax=Heyndrickxia sporothermodurans TaxID=46224 RepID=A0A150LD89_9BACI|nr:hypothetical protein B4102_2402 [Heyndrickxia sporothermodurans]